MNKNINGSTSSNLGYTGIVKLSQYNQGKKFKVAEIHNAGGKPLFDFLADCLLGNFSADIPNKIALLHYDETTEKFTQASGTSFIYLLTMPEKLYSESEGVVRYSFIIPQEYFATNRNDSALFNAIGLYLKSATDVQDYAAYCTINTDEMDISISSVLVLDWELHIANNFQSQGDKF